MAAAAIAINLLDLICVESNAGFNSFTFIIEYANNSLSARSTFRSQ
jgi:hypothetical protein